MVSDERSASQLKSLFRLFSSSKAAVSDYMLLRLAMASL